MSDELENQEDEAKTAEAEGPAGGERLAEARREQHISVDEIAKELHLDEPKVRALERNEFDILGAPVFAKGHLKKYAQLVNVDPDDVLVDYYRLTRSATVPPVVLNRKRPGKELSPGPWIAVIVVIIIVVTAFWWFTRPADLEPVLEPEVQMEDVLPAQPVDESAIPPGSDEDLAETAPQVTEPVIQNDPEPEPEPEPEQVIEDGQMHVLVTYTGDCWTEITDSNGRRLLFALGQDGRTVELSGAEPFNVLFGNPGNVSLRVNGEERPLPPTNRPDRPMRLTLSGT